MATQIQPFHFQGTPTSQTLTVPSQTSSPLLKSRLLGSDRKASIAYPDSDFNFSLQALSDVVEVRVRREEEKGVESEVSAVHMTMDFKTEVLWEDAARAKWHAQSALYLVGNIKDAVSKLGIFEEKKETSLLGIAGSIMEGNSDSLAKSLQTVYEYVSDFFS